MVRLSAAESEKLKEAATKLAASLARQRLNTHNPTAIADAAESARRTIRGQ